MDWSSWYKEHRSNFFFWVLGTLGSGSVMGTVGHAIANDIHGHPTDWWLSALFMFSGTMISIVASRFALKRPDRGTVEGAGPELIASPLGSLHHDGVVMPFADLNAVARNQDLVDLGMLAENLFTPLQMEALKLAHDLSGLIKPDKEKPSRLPNRDEEFRRIYDEGRERSLRISGAYAEDYAPRVKSFLNKIRKNNENDIYLPQFVENVDSESSVELVIARLWVYVMASTGVNLKGQL